MDAAPQSNQLLPEWARPLDLAPHPEGGWYRETWRSEVTFPAEALPDGYPADRSAGTAVFYLLPAGQTGAWHAVLGAELWLHHRGGPLELELGGDGEQPATESIHSLGADIDSGQQPQVLIPAGRWQRARNVG